MRWFGLLACCLVAVACSPAARAELPAPATKEFFERFRLCYAAAVLHETKADWETARFTKSQTKTLIDQFRYVMAESLFGALSPSVAESRKRVEYAEKHFFNIVEAIRSAGPALDDQAQREAILSECPELAWITVKAEIDWLMQARARRADEPEKFKLVE